MRNKTSPCWIQSKYCTSKEANCVCIAQARQLSPHYDSAQLRRDLTGKNGGPSNKYEQCTSHNTSRAMQVSSLVLLVQKCGSVFFVVLHVTIASVLSCVYLLSILHSDDRESCGKRVEFRASSARERFPSPLPRESSGESHVEACFYSYV